MAKATIKRTKDFEAGTVAFAPLGEDGNPIDSLSFVAKSTDFSDDIQKSLLTHAINAKIGDAGAGKSGQEAYDAMVSVYEQLKAGEWTARSGGGEGGTRVTLLVEALMQVKGQDQETVIGKLNDMDDEAKKMLRNHPQVKAAMSAIKLEREKAKAKELAKDAKEVDALDF